MPSGAPWGRKIASDTLDLSYQYRKDCSSPASIDRCSHRKPEVLKASVHRPQNILSLADATQPSTPAALLLSHSIR